MNLKLPPIIQKYVEASNRHDVRSILSCFSDGAVVRDEGETLHGKQAIEGWIVKTIEKYKFQFKPIGVRQDDTELVLAIEVSGTFPGSPVTPGYHFTIESDKIGSLVID
jgi:ketosteroid isomerase-like protein